MSSNAVLKQVESDLSVFEAFIADDAKLATARATLANKEADSDALTSAIPLPVLQVLIGLRNPAVFDQTYDGASEELRAKLQKVREQVLTLFTGVELNPAVQTILTRLGRRAAPKKDSQGDFKLNIIESISWIPMWSQGDDGLTPLVRLSFQMEPDRVLLDSTLNLNSLSYVAATLFHILGDEMERVVSFPKDSSLRLSLAGEMSDERLDEIHFDLKRIEQAWSEVNKKASAPK